MDRPAHLLGRVHHLGIGILVAFTLALAASGHAADRPVVGILPPLLPFEDSKHLSQAAGLVDLVQAAMDSDERLRFVERQEIERLTQDHRLALALGRADSLILGRAIGADLLVLPRFTRDRETWSLRMIVIDPEKADVFGEVSGKIVGDHESGPRSLDPEQWAAALADRLTKDAARLTEVRERTPVALLFFGNTTESNDRLNSFSDDLASAIREANRPGVRMLRFPAVGTSRGEQLLAMGGLTAGAERWQEIAQWWVWGEYQEFDWEGKPFAEAGVRVRVTVWDGEHEPVIIEERGTAGDLAELAMRVAGRVADTVTTKPPSRPLPPQQLAARLLAQANVLHGQNIGGERGSRARGSTAGARPAESSTWGGSSRPKIGPWRSTGCAPASATTWSL